MALRCNQGFKLSPVTIPAPGKVNRAQPIPRRQTMPRIRWVNSIPTPVLGGSLFAGCVENALVVDHWQFVLGSQSCYRLRPHFHLR